ncbi:MAG: glycosyltransferase family 4 protein [Armatimonadetes bacterium]|nr:glycosyltransferase family 4 protein [Armatimonadota bacterium]
MRVLYFGEGLGVHDARFLAAYSNRGHHVTFLGLLDSPSDHRHIGAPIRVQRLDWAWRPNEDPGTYLALRDVDVDAWCEATTDTLRGRQFDIVHAGPLTTAGWIAARAGLAPLLAMSWGSDVLGDLAAESSSRARATVALDCARWIQCDSIAVEQRLVQDFHVDRARLIRFPWGVDQTVFRPDASVASNEEDGVSVISLRSWEPVCDIQTVLRAFAIAAEQDPLLRLSLAGDGSAREWVEGFVADTGLAARVDFLGVLDCHMVVDELRHSDIYLSCSRSDGSSVSLLEAMAVGPTPVVSDIPGNREWIRDCINGRLVGPGEAEGFARAILDIAAAPEVRVRAAELNRQIVLERACWPENVALLFKAIES